VLVLVLRAGLALFWGFLDTYLYFQAQLWVDTRARGKLFSIQKGEFRKSSRLDTHLSTTINYPQPSSLTTRGNCAAWGTLWEVETRRDCARACPSTERRKRVLMYKANLRSPGADPSGAHPPGGWSSSVETKGNRMTNTQKEPDRKSSSSHVVIPSGCPTPFLRPPVFPPLAPHTSRGVAAAHHLFHQSLRWLRLIPAPSRFVPVLPALATSMQRVSARALSAFSRDARIIAVVTGPVAVLAVEAAVEPAEEEHWSLVGGIGGEEGWMERDVLWQRGGRGVGSGLEGDSR
jgi:hypothetical protein